jgi:hypothetical protein
MKCPACWAEKAYRRNEEGARALLLKCLWFVPMRCRHCYHKFWVHRAFAYGAVIDPPAKPLAATPVQRSSVAVQHLSRQASSDHDENSQADAA